MNFLDLFWHICDFAAPAILLGVISATAAKWLWRGPLRTVPWIHLGCSAAAASLLACIAGLVITGRDGKMVTYAAMVLACAISLWWRMRGR
jgi:hypothetical protein